MKDTGNENTAWFRLVKKHMLAMLQTALAGADVTIAAA